VANATASGDSQVLDIDPASMFVGGTLSSENVVTNGFDGCLWGLQLNGYNVPFTNTDHEIFSAILPSKGIVHTCPELVETAPITFQEEENSIVFHIAILTLLLFVLFLSIILVVGGKLLNHYCIKNRGKFVIGHRIAIQTNRRSHSRSASSENIRPYHTGELDNDEFSFHELRSLERPFTNLQEAVQPQSPLRYSAVKRTPDHHHEASASQLSDAYTMSAASALDVTATESNIPTLPEQQTSSVMNLESSTAHLLNENQSPRIYEQPMQRQRQQQQQQVPTIVTNGNTETQEEAAGAVGTTSTTLNDVSNFIAKKVAAVNKETENMNYDQLKVYADEGEFDPLGSIGSLYDMNMGEGDDETVSLQSFSHLAEFGNRFQKINRILQRQDSLTAADDVSVTTSSVVFSRERLQQEPYHDRDVRIV